MSFLGRVAPPSRERTSDGGSRRRRRRSSPGTKRPSLSPDRPTPGAGSVTGVQISRDAITPSKVSPLFLQTGSVQLSISAASTGLVAVSFARKFNATPRVLLTLNSSSTTNLGWVVGAESITSSGFSVRVRQINDTSTTTTLTIQFLAVVTS